MRYLHLGPAMTFPSLFASESEGRAEVASSASPAGAEVGGRLTPCRVVDCGLVGVVDEAGANQGGGAN
jgi:hypothetical protein